MIPEVAFRRTYAVKCGSNVGTAVLIDLEKSHFLVSAKHVFDEYDSDKSIELLAGHGWQRLSHTLCSRGSSKEVKDDYIVFEIGSKPQNAPALEFHEFDKIFIGQDAFILGYPLLWPSPLSRANNGFLPALAKRAMFSGLVSAGGFDKLYTLDVMLNKGMSGGPVFARDHQLLGAVGLAGIAVSYYSPAELITGDQNEALSFNANTGIAFCIPIGHILSRIR